MHESKHRANRGCAARVSYERRETKRDLQKDKAYMQCIFFPLSMLFISRTLTVLLPQQLSSLNTASTD